MTTHIELPEADIIARAGVVAATAHAGQTRKGSPVPYIVHPYEVSRILRRHGFDESFDQLHAAALLHDVVEDTDWTLADLQKLFPTEVADWVEATSEVKEDSRGQKLPWKTRKTEHLDRLQTSDWQVAAITLADKIHNLQDIVDRPREPSYWSIFSAPPSELIWYYRSVLKACSRPAPSEAVKMDALAAKATALVHQLEAIAPDDSDLSTAT